MRPFFIVVFLVFTVVIPKTASSVCPQDSLDRGNCDTMYIEPWPADIADSVLSHPGPYFIRVPIYVTADVNDVYDSISAFTFPFCYTHSNPSKYCSVSQYWNALPFIMHLLPRSIFRHLPSNADPQIHNWMMDLWETGDGAEWDWLTLFLDDQTSHFWLSLIASGTEDLKFGSGNKVLLATMTFKVEDTMTICVDTCFWPSAGRLAWYVQPVGGGEWVSKIPRLGSPLDSTSYKTCFKLPTVCLVNSTSLNFGNVLVGDTSDLTFTITNNSGETLSGTVSETCNEYSLMGDVAYVLAAWQSQTFTVRFTPTSPGNKYCFIETGNDDLCLDVSCRGYAVSPPRIESISPTQNQLNVPVNTNISVTFDIFIYPTTNNDSTFVVNAWSAGLHIGSIIYDSTTKTATLTPTKDFEVGEIVTVVLSTGIRSLDGTPMENSYVWSFTTNVEDGTSCFAPAVNYRAGDHPWSVFCADLNGDGYLDLVVTNCFSNDVSILNNNGDGSFQSAVNYEVGDEPSSVFCADLDRDADQDLVVANYNSLNVSILKNNGNGTFQSAINYGTDNGSVSVFCADLDGDADLDLAVANQRSDNVSILKNNGDGTFQSAVNYETGWGPINISCADLDNDGDLDLVAVNSNVDYVSIFRNNGDGSFQSAVTYGAGDHPVSVFCADLDGDSDLDLAVANYLSHDVSVLRNKGDGSFQNPVNYSVVAFARSVFCADLYGNHNLDLVVANYSSRSVSILKNNGDGSFQSAVNYGTGDFPISVFCADLDEDGNLDLTVANCGSDNVSILFNIRRGDCTDDKVIDVGDVVFLINYLFKNGPEPACLSVGDVNCDGIFDVGDVVYLINYLFKGGPAPSC